MIQTLSVISKHPAGAGDIKGSKEAAESRVQALANDLCASMPYLFGILDIPFLLQQNEQLSVKTATDLQGVVTASTASLLCWPLAMANMITCLPHRHAFYLKNRLRDVSELVDDGLLGRLADA